MIIYSETSFCRITTIFHVHVLTFWVVTPCTDAGEHNYFGYIHCPHIPYRNTCFHSGNYKFSEPKLPKSETSSPINTKIHIHVSLFSLHALGFCAVDKI